MGIGAVVVYVLLGLFVVGMLAYLERGRRESNAYEKRYREKRAELEQRWNYLFELLLERRQQDAAEPEPAALCSRCKGPLNA